MQRSTSFRFDGLTSLFPPHVHFSLCGSRSPLLFNHLVQSVAAGASGQAEPGAVLRLRGVSPPQSRRQQPRILRTCHMGNDFQRERDGQWVQPRAWRPGVRGSLGVLISLLLLVAHGGLRLAEKDV